MKKKLLAEDLKKLGKIKLATDSHRFKMSRGTNRKNLRQVPDSHVTQTTKTDVQTTLGQFVKSMDMSNKIVDIAKKTPSGVWRISKEQVLEIAKKYKFNIPDNEKPMKHLGSTGIQMVRYKPGVFYLYKPHKPTRKRRKSGEKRIGSFHMGM